MGQVEWGPIMTDLRKASAAIEGVPERLYAIEQSTSTNAKSIDELYKIARRPAYGNGSAVDDLERKDAEAHCRTRRALTIPKVECNVASDYTPSPSEIDEALTARKAMRALWRHGDPSRLEPTEKKSLMQWHAGGSYLMNQRTFALLLTMSDANGRPLLNMMPQG